jgi:hypothetical protein
MIDILVTWAGRDSERCVAVDDFMFDIMRNLKGTVPDSTVLQEDVEKNEGALAEDIAGKALVAVKARWPAGKYEGVVTDGGTYQHKPDPRVRLDAIPIRVVAALLYLGIVSEEANRSDLWGYSKIGKPESSRMASVYMPLAYYFLRVWMGASEAQSAQSVRH